MLRVANITLRVLCADLGEGPDAIAEYIEDVLMEQWQPYHNSNVHDYPLVEEILDYLASWEEEERR